MTASHGAMSRRATLALGAVLLGGIIAARPLSLEAFRDRDCSDFKTQKKARKFFKKHGGPKKDPHGLDADNDGKACEELD